MARGPARTVPSSADAHLRAAAVWDRHNRADDPNLWRLTEVMDNLAAVIDYVARHPAALKDSDRAAEALDVLVIIRWQERQLHLRERNMITLARAWKTRWSDIAPALGFGSIQAAEQHYKRLLAWSAPLDLGLSTPGPRSEAAYRRGRAAITDPEERVKYPSTRDPAPATVTAVVALLGRLASQRRDVPADLLEDLAAALDSPNPANTLGLVRSVVRDLVDRVDELPPALATLAREAAALLSR